MTDKRLSNLAKLIENRLNYFHFFEADKSRFIKPLFDTYKDVSPYSLDEILEFYKKHNEVKVDWNQKDKENLFLDLINIMNDNKKKNEQKNEEKKYYRQDNAKELLKSNPEFVVMDELENDNWVFACPTSWEAAKFADSAECGGAGAKWCIGYEQDNKYWKHYVNTQEDVFVFALRKDFKFYKNQNRIKYMIEIFKEGTFKVWEQKDKDIIDSDEEKFFKLFKVDFKKLKDIATPIFWDNIEKGYRIEGSILIIDDIKEFNDRYLKNPEKIETIIFPEGVKHSNFTVKKEYPNLKEVILPDSLEELETASTMVVPLYNSHTFFRLSKEYEGSYSIPNGIRNIDNRAFMFKVNLTDIYMPDSVINIGYEAFTYCSKLKNIKLSKNLQSIGLGAFNGCRSLESIIIPDSVNNISSEVFKNCTKLKRVNLGQGVTSIGYRVFDGCSNLEEVILSDNLEEIGCQSFSYCENIKNFSIGDKVRLIDEGAFQDSGLINITIPKNVEYIKNNAFTRCRNLEKITFEGCPKYIGEFHDVPKLKKIYVLKEHIETFRKLIKTNDNFQPELIPV